jgi:hypothetical protein
MELQLNTPQDLFVCVVHLWMCVVSARGAHAFVSVLTLACACEARGGCVLLCFAVTLCLTPLWHSLSLNPKPSSFRLGCWLVGLSNFLPLSPTTHQQWVFRDMWPCLLFHMGAEALNSGPPAYTNPLSHLYRFHLKYLKKYIFWILLRRKRIKEESKNKENNWRVVLG